MKSETPSPKPAKPKRTKQAIPNPELSNAIVTSSHFRVIAPKPTKNEIIEALTQIRIEELRKEVMAAIEQRDALAKECRELILDWHKSSGEAEPKVDLGHPDRKWDQSKGERVMTGATYGVEITFECPVLPEKIKDKLLEFHRAAERAYMSHTVDSVRKEIRDKLIVSKDSRVSALLSDPESRKTLEEALASITAQP